MTDRSSTPKVLEGGVLLWTPKRADHSSTEEEWRRSSTPKEPQQSTAKEPQQSTAMEPQRSTAKEPKRPSTAEEPKRPSTAEEPEGRGLHFRVATALAVLASVVMIVVAYKAIFPGGKQARRYNIYEEEQYDVSQEEMAAGPARERKATPVPATVTPSATEERERASLPDPKEFFEELIQSIWDQTDSTPAGVTVGNSSRSLRAALAKAFGRRPTHVELVNLPLPGTTGLCTLKVSDDQGRQALIGVRLVRLKGSETPWEVESLVVMDSTAPPRFQRAPR